MRLIVTVKEGVEDIVKPNLLKVDDYYFESLFHKVTVDAYKKILCRVDEKSSWVHIENSDDLLADHSAAPRRELLHISISKFSYYIMYIKYLTVY
jgi:hypothetical protein